MDMHGVVQSAIPLLTAFALKVVGAIVLWIIGRKLITIARGLVVRSGSGRPARQWRESRGGDPTPEGAAAPDSQRGRGATARRRDPHLHAARPRAGRAPLLSQRSLLAGLFRYEPLDPRGGWRRELPGASAARLRPQWHLIAERPSGVLRGAAGLAGAGLRGRSRGRAKLDNIRDNFHTLGANRDLFRKGGCQRRSARDRHSG